MEKRVRKVRKTVRQRNPVLIAFQWTVAIVIALVVMLGLWRWRGQTAYAAWRNTKRLATSERLLRSGKFDEAAMMARAVFDSDVKNVAAARLLGAVAESISPFTALPWRQRVTDLEPWNPTNRIELALTALRAGDNYTASRALAGVPTNPPPPVSFYEASGAVAFAFGDLLKAESNFAQAARLDPANVDRQFNLAKVRLVSDSPTRNAEARQTLDRLSTNPPTRIAALTLRIEDALRVGRNAEAVRLADQLAAVTNAPMSGHLLRLTALQAARSPKINSVLAELQKSAVQSPNDFAQLILWMNRSGMNPAAMAWIRTLPRERLSDPAVRIAVADLFIGIKDWLGLRQWVRAEDWKNFNSFRLAYDSLASQFLSTAESRTTEMETLWQRAVKAADNNPAQLQALVKLAAQWRMPQQMESTLWTIADSRIAEEASLMELHQIYLKKNDALGQLKVARRLFALRRDDPSALNNVVYLGLLLDTKDTQLQQWADLLHTRSTNDVNHVATYAFALFRRGQPAKAVEVMNGLGPEVVHRPAMAAMQGVFLAHAGNAKGAREFLTLARGVNLLPEEERLVSDARAMARMTP